MPPIAYFNPSSSHGDRARQMWQILIVHAHHRQTITYGALSVMMYGHPCPHVLSQVAGRIALWCHDRLLPLLNVLVVNEKLGTPGDGCPATAYRTFNEVREAVYQINWYDIVPPTHDELEASWYNHV